MKGFPSFLVFILFLGCISPDDSSDQDTGKEPLVSLASSPNLKEDSGIPMLEGIGSQVVDINGAPQSVGDCDSAIDVNWKDGCYWTFGVELKNLTICDRIVDQNAKDWCYSGVGGKLKNSTICDLIQTKDAKKQCFDLITQSNSPHQ